MRTNLTPLAGPVVFALVFLGVYGARHTLVIAVVLALILGIAAALIVHGLIPSDESLAEYNLDAKRRVKKLKQVVEQINDLNKQVRNQTSKDTIRQACERIMRVIDLTQQKDASSVASTAAKLNVYLVSVSGVLSTYLEIQRDPDIPGNAEVLQAVEEGFGNFGIFAQDRVKQALAGDIMRMQADLATMRPMTMPELH